ncbi:DNA-binding transcriptional regulator, LysR family [Modicisalibacter muralis]|uniref:DNA-binding transcriptional regulator, LysR family n=1 Tax=Modicisalibacter muralis TaxID=119000 RepID=A0A1G9NPX2_9GAMM|nr:LysR substrate-binding domain-containing protein [Halomonas muralis]SDL88404.1 DNA-binding transcriptional regulator, LysR family [Halomonas muralis]
MSEVPVAALDLELLRSFQAAAHLGSLAAAAEQRHRTISAISMQLKRLEEVLEIRLLERGPRGVTPTAAGEALLRESRELLRLHDGMLARFTGRGLGGKVRFGLPEDYARELLGDVLPDFLARHPDVLLEAVTATSGELARQLTQSNLALAVLLDRPRRLPDGEALWQTSPVWAGPRLGRLAERPSLPLALHHVDCPYRDLAVESLDAIGKPWHAVFTSTSIHAVEKAIEAGLAIGVLDRQRLTPAMRELGEAEGLPALRPCEARLHFATRIERASRPAVEALAVLLRERLFERGPWRADAMR